MYINSLLICVVSIYLSHVDSQQVPPVGGDAVPPIVHEFIILNPEPMENVFGKTDLKLECVVSGNPLPIVEWSFQNVKFEKDKPFSGVEGDAVRHEMTGNRLTIKSVRGLSTRDPGKTFDSGRYRCIATNEIGSVFLERNIQVRVMGYFRPNSQFHKDASKLNVVVGRNFIIPCPPHVTGFGTTYSWGKVTLEDVNRIVTPYLPGQINDHLFYTLDGRLVYSVVTEGDVVESTTIGGLRCMLSNGNEINFSNQQMLWKFDVTKTDERYEPNIIATLPPAMFAPIDTAYTMTCGATGKPAPEYTWEYQGIKVESRFNGSKELNFEFFQIVGNGMQLKIQRITQYSGGTFRCNAENGAGQRWSIGQLTVTFPPIWINKFEEIVDLPLEEKLVLVCNATGVPKPRFEWFQNSTMMVSTDDTRKVITYDKKYGGSNLTITKSNYDDNGIYICVAINDLETLTQSTFIRVQDKAPEFKIPVNDPLYLFRTSTMYVACEVSGGPIPEKVWSKDGKVIAEDSRFITHKNGTLEIRNVQDTDAGEYTCTATNTNGKASSMGLAVVLEPTVITNPPKSHIYDVSWPYAALFCGASWDKRLDLRIEWYKGDVRMTKFSDKIFLEKRATGPPRILYLRYLTIDDAGNYSCHAYTKVGNVVSEQTKYAYLYIKGPPEPPAGVYVDGDCSRYSATIHWKRGEELNVETRYFFIEFSTNISSQYNDWFGGEGDPQIPNSRISAEPGTRVSFPLGRAQLVPGANLIFRIKAASELLMGRASLPSKPNECTTPPGRPVLNPLNVTGYANGTGNLYIKWKAVTDVYYGATGFYYEVGYRLVGATAFTKRDIKDLNTTMIEVTKTEVYKQYVFYVQSHNDLGAGPAYKLVYAYSGAKVPEQRPTRFRTKFILRYSIELAWDKVEGADGYRVTYWNISNAEALRGRARRAAGMDAIVYKTQDFLGEDYDNGGSLTNVSAQHDFIATVAAINTGGVGPQSEPIEFQSQSRVPGVPHNVDFIVYGQSAHISWNPPIEPNGYIEQYEISWVHSDQDNVQLTQQGETRTLTMDRRSREAYMIEIFQPMTYYNIKLFARNRVGPGDDWEKILVAVSAPDIPGKPGAPKAALFDDSAINITFQRPSYGGLPTKFMVYYRPTGQYYMQPKVVEQAFPQRAWILVKDLNFLVYDFWTVGVNGLGESETSDVTEQQPVRRAKPQAHASDFPWYRSNWFVAIGLCLLFIFITLITVIMLLRSGPIVYKRLKDANTFNGAYSGKSGFKNGGGGQQMQPLVKAQVPMAVDGGYPMGATGGYDDGRNQSASEVPSDGPPPRYSDQSSLEKKRFTDDESDDGSRTGTGSDYSDSETGSDSRSGSGSEYSDEETGSQYSDEEKKRDSEESEPEDDGTFV